ncbi:MAG: hypothetical protein FWD71_23445 [Oscillospiraceae bacterium]|nr:hypothetical protein [Oscillospiraceae bacterium]
MRVKPQVSGNDEQTAYIRDTLVRSVCGVFPLFYFCQQIRLYADFLDI